MNRLRQLSDPDNLPALDMRAVQRNPAADLADVMEELVRFTLLTRSQAGLLIDRYSEHKEVIEKQVCDAATNLSAIATAHQKP